LCPFRGRVRPINGSLWDIIAIHRGRLVRVLDSISRIAGQDLDVCFLDFVGIVVRIEVGKHSRACTWRADDTGVETGREVLEVLLVGVDLCGGLEAGEPRGAEGEVGGIVRGVVRTLFCGWLEWNETEGRGKGTDVDIIRGIDHQDRCSRFGEVVGVIPILNCPIIRPVV